MATQEQFRTLSEMVFEALNYRRYRGGNNNPTLGKAILYVNDILLPWARTQAAGEFDVQDIVADAGLKMLRLFPKFRGTTGGEFFDCMTAIVARGVARMRRLMEAKEKGCLRRALSLERDGEAARLAERLASRERLPDVAAVIRENAHRLHKAMRGLSAVQLLVVRLHGIDGCPFQEVGAKFGHTASWAHDIWEAAAAEIRRRLMRPRRGRRCAACSA
jgi:DNA-directed RNA polymerase specialized sigma24 family protein